MNLHINGLGAALVTGKIFLMVLTEECMRRANDLLLKAYGG
jgi:hypothetical protein